MDDQRALEVLGRARRQEQERLAEERRAAAAYAEELEARQQATKWAAEYETVRARREPLTAEIAAIDAAMIDALGALQIAHERAFDLLGKRKALALQAATVNRRLSRLAGWLGTSWRADAVVVDDGPLSWKQEAFVGRPWPR